MSDNLSGLTTCASCGSEIYTQETIEFVELRHVYIARRERIDIGGGRTMAIPGAGDPARFAEWRLLLRALPGGVC